METTTKAQQSLSFITKAIGEGKTIYIGTRLKTTKVTPKCYAKWEASGHKLFIIDQEGNLRIAAGKMYNIICTKHHCMVQIVAQ